MTRFESNVRDSGPSVAPVQPQHVDLAASEAREILRKTAGSSPSGNSLAEVSFTNDRKENLGDIPVPAPRHELRAAPKAEPSVIEKTNQAIQEFDRTNKLSPEIKKLFEEAIADSDKGASKKIPDLEKKIRELSIEYEKAMPESLQKEIQGFAEQVNKKLAQSTPEQKKELKELVAKASSGDAAERAAAEVGIEKMMQSIAPVAYNKAKELAAPGNAIAIKHAAAEDALLAEQNQGAIARFAYARTLLLSGEVAQSRALLKETAQKFPIALEEKAFQNLLKATGLDDKELRPKK